MQTLVNFTELLSLGFATIGPRATLITIGGQLAEDAMHALRLSRQRYQHANPS